MTAAFFQSRPFRDIVERLYPTSLQDDAERWAAYRERLIAYEDAGRLATELTAQLVTGPLQDANPQRFVCRLDRGSQVTKTPQSIDDKLFRYLSGRKVVGQAVTQSILRRLVAEKERPERFLDLVFRDLPGILNDLARFRIVGNFLTDIRNVAEVLRSDVFEPYTDRLRVDPAIEDRVEDDRWESSSTGHRAIHLRMQACIGGEWLGIEVQVMTMLELGWDHKAHLIYEHSRRGNREIVDKRARLGIGAVSDTLYVADAFFDRLFHETFETSAGTREEES